MVIGIDASRANRPNKTGTEWYAYHIIRALAELDTHNQYILYSDQPLEAGLDEVCQRQANFKVKVLRWPLRRFWTLGRLTIEMLVNPPDVLFVPSHVLPLWSRAKMVNTIHDVGFMAFKQVYRWSDRQYLRWSTKYAISLAKRLIAVSDFTKQELLRYFPSAQSGQITVVHHGYDHQLYRPMTDSGADQAVLKRYQLTTPYLIYVGRLESKKNIIGLLNGFRRYLQDNPQSLVQLVLVGRRSTDYGAVNNLLADPVLRGRTIELGWLPEEAVPSLMRQASGFIMPSWYEGFGLPVVQAMAVGTPVLLARTGSLPEIGEQAAIYFEPDNTDELAQKINQLITDSQFRQQLIEAGPRQASQFSWPKAAQETLAVLEQANA